MGNMIHSTTTSRQSDMKTELIIVASLSFSALAANNYGSNYGEYDTQYNNQQYQLETAQYQPGRYDTQPYQQDTVADRYDTEPYQQDPLADRYDTVPYQQNSYATPYQAAQYQPVQHEAVHPAHHQEEEEKYPPKPFAYEYGGADESGRHFAKTETSDDDGVVRGEYRVELPDGRVQIVSYTADHVNGYQADVRYEGEAKPYVPEPEYDEPRQKYVPQHKPYARRY